MFRVLKVRGCFLGKRGWGGRGFSTTGKMGGYADTLGNLRIGRDTRVIFQGFTGLFYLVQSLLWNTYSTSSGTIGSIV